jgi:hypothetical protein
MNQSSFWVSVWEPLEIGWWVEYALQNKIREFPNHAHSVVTLTGEPVCGFVPHVFNNTMTHISNILGNGDLLHLSKGIKDAW